MRLTNGWVGYITRSYSQIKSSLINRLTTLVPELTDHSESNLMIRIISMFAGLGEQFHYYIDNIARESYISSARRYSSMVKLVKLVDYRIHASIPASVDLTLTFNIPLPANYTLPIGTIFSDSSGNDFISIASVQGLIGATSISVPVEQKSYVSGQVLGITQGIADEVFILPNNFVDNTLIASIGLDTSWVYKETLGLSDPLDKHYTVFVDINQNLFLQFGDGINGAIPTGSENVNADYYTTKGLLGNVAVDSITNIVSTLTLPAGVTATVSNDFEATGGLGIQVIESIRKKAPLSVRTLDRAVTRQDYIDVAIMAPGVNTADLFFDCGKTIDIFISPEGGGVAQTPLLNSVKTFIDSRRMVTTFVNVRPAGESIINIKLTAKARFRLDVLQTQTSIETALLDLYSLDKSDVNKAVRRSDIYATVDNLPEVEYLTLDELSITPYARPTNHTTQLNWTVSILTGSTATFGWKVEYTGVNFNLFKNGQFIANLTTGIPFTDPLNTITITINSGPYLGGYEWDFITLPINEDLTVNDFSLPLTELNSLNIIVQENTIIN